jgi:carbamoyltransferase
MKKPTSYILGVSISHDATAVLLNGDGTVLAGIGEERLTRQKYHETFPFQAIRWLLQYTGIEGDDITEVAYNWRNIGGSRPYRVNIFTPGSNSVDWANDIAMSVSSRVTIDWLLNRFRLYRRIFPDVSDAQYVRHALKECGITTEAVTAFDHQLCHASSTFFSSDLETSLVVSIDGYGDDKSGGIYIGKNNSIRRVEDIPDDVSAGAFYANVTGALGFKRNRHEGKITGLAASGESSRCEDILRNYFDLGDDLRFSRLLNVERNKAIEIRNMLRFFFSGKYELTDDYFRLMKDSINSGGFDQSDVAAAAQTILEDVVSRLIDDRMNRYQCRHLAVAGGVFANVKLNQTISELDSVRKFFVHPNMGDGGGAYGASMLALARNRAKPFPPLTDVYWGPEYTDEQIKSSLDELGVQAEWMEDIEKEIALLLAERMIVGRFNGRMEYGPRALCNRSILVEPGHASINIELNNRLGRTEFMPFAPVVLLEYGPELFYRFEETINSSKYMTITLKVREHWVEKIGAVVHLDNTARPQWVSENYNPSAYRVLNAFYDITGVPALINTSFNKHEEPIVCTPKDAISAWKNNSIDVLAIGNYLVR